MSSPITFKHISPILRRWPLCRKFIDPPLALRVWGSKMWAWEGEAWEGEPIVSLPGEFFSFCICVCAYIYIYTHTQRGVFSEISVSCPSAPNNWYQSMVEGGGSPGSTVLCTLLEIEKTEVGQKLVLTTNSDSPWRDNHNSTCPPPRCVRNSSHAWREGGTWARVDLTHPTRRSEVSRAGESDGTNTLFGTTR